MFLSPRPFTPIESPTSWRECDFFTAIMLCDGVDSLQTGRAQDHEARLSAL